MLCWPMLLLLLLLLLLLTGLRVAQGWFSGSSTSSRSSLWLALQERAARHRMEGNVSAR
jgi:hypothetical protein